MRGVTFGVFAAVADHGIFVRIQRLDETWLRSMISAPLTAIAKIFNLLGLVYVTLPVRIALACSPCGGAGGIWPPSPRPLWRLRP